MIVQLKNFSCLFAPFLNGITTLEHFFCASYVAIRLHGPHFCTCMAKKDHKNTNFSFDLANSRFSLSYGMSNKCGLKMVFLGNILEFMRSTYNLTCKTKGSNWKWTQLKARKFWSFFFPFCMKIVCHPLNGKKAVKMTNEAYINGLFYGSVRVTSVCFRVSHTHAQRWKHLTDCLAINYGHGRKKLSHFLAGRTTEKNC